MSRVASQQLEKGKGVGAGTPENEHADTLIL